METNVTLAEKLGSDRISQVEREQFVEHRQEMIGQIVERIEKLEGGAVSLLRNCSVDGMIHPDKLAAALQNVIPATWEAVVVDTTTTKTPNEQLAGIVARSVRSLANERFSIIASSLGITADEQTRAVKKVLKTEAIGDLAKAGIPVKVAPANKASRKDHLLAMLAAVGLDK